MAVVVVLAAVVLAVVLAAVVAVVGQHRKLKANLPSDSCLATTQS